MKSEFRRDVFLLWMLAGVFIFQAGVFIFALVACWKLGGLEACPQIGRRFDQTFGVMIATILALLTGTTALSRSRTPSPKDLPEVPKIEDLPSPPPHKGKKLE